MAVDLVLDLGERGGRFSGLGEAMYRASHGKALKARRAYCGRENWLRSQTSMFPREQY